MNGGWSISYEIALRWMPLELTDDKSTLVQAMACCRQGVMTRNSIDYWMFHNNLLWYSLINCIKVRNSASEHIMLNSIYFSWYILIDKWLEISVLNHLGRVMQICVGNLTIIASDNGLSPGKCQAIIWTNAGILLIRPLGANFSEILIKFMHFHSLKRIWKCCLWNRGHFS